MGLTPEMAVDPKRGGIHLPSSQSQAPPEKGHGRGRLVTHQVGGSPELRGVPLIGTGSGAIKGTMPKPGCSGAALEREARELAQHTVLVIRQRVSASGVLRVTRSIR